MLNSKALIIEDDPDITSLIATNISEIGLELDSAAAGDIGLQMALANDYRVVIVDLNLPVIGGMEICRKLREQKPLLPILILSSRSDEIDKVSGLQLGADDYVVKPFSIRELLARISALLRRSEKNEAASNAEPSDILEFDSLRIDTGARTITWNGAQIELTPTEYDIVAYLALKPGRVFTRTQIVENVLGYRGGGYEATVNSHVSRIRKKFQKIAPGMELLRASWGVGYCFCYGLPDQGPDPEQSPEEDLENGEEQQGE